MEENQEESVLLESYNSENGKILILDNDEHSIWAFVMDAETQEIELDGFLCSLSEPFASPEEVEKIMGDDMSPPITIEYASEYAYQKEALTAEFQVDWQDDGYVFVYINEELFLVIDLEEEVSFSKSIKEEGPYGFPLTDEVLQELGFSENE